jgi:[protein-PII] uridylyltransferase
VLQLIDQPDVTGLDARNLVERRRAEAARLAGDDPHVVDRIERAPRAYLLSQQGADIARQARFVEPVPARGEASVAVLPAEPGPNPSNGSAPHERWRIEVAARDRPGLLATIAGVVAEAGFDILDAAVATWADGAALDTFLVQDTGGAAPDPVRLESDIVAAFDTPLDSRPNPDAELRFDDHASPWYTICEVRSPDRRGLLRSLAAAMASAGANVYSARLVTVDGTVVDRFELTDRNERKLSEEAKGAVVRAVHDGVAPKRRLLSRRR